MTPRFSSWAGAPSGMSKATFWTGTATSPVQSGWTRVTPQLYSSAVGYGWQSVSGLGSFDRGVGSALTRDGILGTSGTFLVDGIWQGTWEIRNQTLRIQPFTELRREDHDALQTEAAQLCAFAAPEAKHGKILDP